MTAIRSNIPMPNWPNHNGELFDNWAGELTYPNTTNFLEHFRLYEDMVDWILNNIDDPWHNACWNKISDCIYIQFRKERDMTWFVLRWAE